MRLLVLVEDLNLGGVQRAASALSAAWSLDGHDVAVLTFEEPDQKGHYKLDERVQLLQVGDLRRFFKSGVYFGKVLGAVRCILKLREILKKEVERGDPLIAIGFLSHMSFYGRIASLFLRVKFVSTERTFPPREFQNSSVFFNLAKYLCFYLSDRVVVLTESAKNYFPEHIRKNIRVIPNTINLEFSKSAEKDHLPERLPTNKIILAVGRLSEEKRYDLLIKSFSKVRGQYPNWIVWIAGEGPERLELERLIEEKQMKDSIFLLGTIRNPEQLYSIADFFVLTSDFEGFPNALCEAMASGLCSISTDCLSGPREMITSGSDGFLIPTNDEDALVRHMTIVMNDDNLRKSIGMAAKKSIQRYSWPVIAPLWNNLFMELGSH